jgi:hypothetical protein
MASPRDEQAEREFAELDAILDRWRARWIERLEADGFSVNARGEVIKPPKLKLVEAPPVIQALAAELEEVEDDA